MPALLYLHDKAKTLSMDHIQRLELHSMQETRRAAGAVHQVGEVSLAAQQITKIALRNTIDRVVFRERSG